MMLFNMPPRPLEPRDLPRRDLRRDAPGADFSSDLDEMIGQNPNFVRVKELIRTIAPAEMSVLITGETGTGKELAARAIHRLSSRHGAPFISVNCAAIPDALLESELFGFEKGAFTGASARQEGKLRAANGGTIFLDEIGDMTLATQAKMLRVLESKEIQPLGATHSAQVDVRVLAATHQDLEQLIAENHFRPDLFYRLNVLPVHLPPLRERRDDIPALIDLYIARLNIEYGRATRGVSNTGLRMLLCQEWPGNIRQLRNVIEGAFLVCRGPWITVEDLRFLHRSLAPAQRISSQASAAVLSYLPVAPEPDRLLGALQATHWNKSKAAELLQWSRMTVYRKIAKYRLTESGHAQDVSELPAASLDAC